MQQPSSVSPPSSQYLQSSPASQSHRASRSSQPLKQRLLQPAAFLAHATHPGATERTVQTVEYEDLLGLWADLESALSVLLANPNQVRGFSAKVRQLDAWLQELVAHDFDAALYLMFQLAATSTAGYSASHALVCATLCHLMALELALPGHERNALVRAALTMNISMTALQDRHSSATLKSTPCAASSCWSNCRWLTTCGWTWWPCTMVLKQMQPRARKLWPAWTPKHAWRAFWPPLTAMPP